MSKPISPPLIAVVSDLVAHAETHASLDSLFMYAEASGEPPAGSKPVKAQEWLRTTNKEHPEPLTVLGRIIAGYMEDPEMEADYEINDWDSSSEWKKIKRANVRKLDVLLARCGLKYMAGGFLTAGGLAPSKKLGELIQGRDMPAIHREFDREISTSTPRKYEAVKNCVRRRSSVVLHSVWNLSGCWTESLSARCRARFWSR